MVHIHFLLEVQELESYSYFHGDLNGFSPQIWNYMNYPSLLKQKLA